MGPDRWKAFWVLESFSFGEQGEEEILVLLTSPPSRKTGRGTTGNVWGYPLGLIKK
jgi:hypothetical protein